MGEEEFIRRRADMSESEFKRLRCSDRWTRVVDGVVIDSTADLSRTALHLVRVKAVVERMASAAVVSHQSAAAVYGMPMWDIPLDAVHVTKNRLGGGRRTRDVVVHAAPIVGPVAVVGHLLVTTPARTIVDCARTLTYEQGVVVGDALCRKFGVTRQCLDVELAHARTRTGIAKARRVVEFVDGHSESVGESLSRITLCRSHIDVLPQGEVFADSGRLLGRADFFAPDQPVVGEFDGDLKYEGPDGREILLREKARENLFRGYGNEVVRWGWRGIDGRSLTEQFARAQERVNPRARRQSWIRQAALPKPAKLAFRLEW